VPKFILMRKRIIGAMGPAIAMQASITQETPNVRLRPDQVAEGR